MFLAQVGPDHVRVALTPRAGCRSRSAGRSRPPAPGRPGPSPGPCRARPGRSGCRSSSRMSRMKRAMSSVSSRFIPATGSSSSSSLGCMASARPSSTRFCTPYGQQPDREPPPLLQLQEVDDVLDRRPVAQLLPARLAEPDDRGEHAVGGVVVAAEHQVVEHGQVGEQLDVLERAGHAELRRSRCGRLPIRSVPSKMTRPDCGRYTPDSTLKIEVLPAPFGPMMREQLVAADREGHPVDRRHARERQPDVVELQHRCLDVGPGGGPLRRRGHDSHRLRRL